MWKSCENGVWKKAETTEVGEAILAFEACRAVPYSSRGRSTFPRLGGCGSCWPGLAALLVLLIIHLIHKLGKARRRQMQAPRKAMQDEQSATDAVIGVIDPDAQTEPVTPEAGAEKEEKTPRLVDCRGRGRCPDHSRNPQLPGQSREQCGCAPAAERSLRPRGNWT